MALPLSRNTTYSPNAPVKSNDLNDVQDCVIAGKHGTRTITYGAAAFQPALAGAYNQLADGRAVISSGGPTPVGAELDLQLPVGTKLKAATVYGSNPTGSVATFKIAVRDITGTAAATTIATATMAAGAAHGGVALAVADRVLAANEVCFVQVSVPATGFVLAGLVLQCTKE